MTPDQIELVTSVVVDVGTHPEFTPRFYERLSAVEPQAAHVLIDLRDDEHDLADELGAMTSLLSDIVALDARARDVGARHRRHGVRAAHYRIARTVMVETLHEVLGPEFGPVEEEAWNRATSLITELIQAS
jgi:hemoglobin-like flavoprotein